MLSHQATDGSHLKLASSSVGRDTRLAPRAEENTTVARLRDAGFGMPVALTSFSGDFAPIFGATILPQI